MTSDLAQMIHGQPEAIGQLADTDLSAPAELLASARRVWLVGTGTSQHAAELGAAALQRLGIDARWEAAARFAHASTQLRRDDAAVVITHTGRTPYAIRSRALIQAASVPLVSITGPDVTWPDAITTPVSEQSETYTVSYTSALTVLARLTHHLGAPDTDVADLHATADRVRQVLADPIIADIPLPARAMAIVGAGDWSITAREGALKIREGARVLCEGFDAERLLHGAAVPYTAADSLVVVQPGADPDGLTAALADAARREGLQVSEITEPDPPASILLAQIPATVRLQLLALRFAAHRGQDPDLAIVGAWADDALWHLGATGTPPPGHPGSP